MTRTIAFALSTIACTGSLLIASPGQDELEVGLTYFEFPGGNLVEYLEAVDTKFEDCSIAIFPGGLEKIQIPPMALKVYSHDELIDLIGSTSAKGGDPNRRGASWTVSPDVNMINEFIYSVAPLVTGSMFSAAADSKAGSSVAVYAGTGNFEMSEVLDAIGAGIEMAVGADGATVRYHEPTSLIFVDTTDKGHEIVASILDQVRRGIPKEGFGTRKKEDESKSRIANLEDQISFLRTKLLELEAANIRLKVELEERRMKPSGDDE